MTRADKFEQVFGYRPATDEIICNENDWCGENDACKYCRSNSKNIGRSEDWWNAEYIEPIAKNDLSSGLEKNSKKLEGSEWQKDHAILKAYSDGANEVLGNIRAEIERQEKWLMDAGYNQYNVDIALDAIKLTVDKYTAESAHDVAQEIVKNNGVVDL